MRGIAIVALSVHSPCLHAASMSRGQCVDCPAGPSRASKAGRAVRSKI